MAGHQQSALSATPYHKILLPYLLPTSPECSFDLGCQAAFSLITRLEFKCQDKRHIPPTCQKAFNKSEGPMPYSEDIDMWTTLRP